MRNSFSDTYWKNLIRNRKKSNDFEISLILNNKVCNVNVSEESENKIVDKFVTTYLERYASEKTKKAIENSNKQNESISYFKLKSGYVKNILNSLKDKLTKKTILSIIYNNIKYIDTLQKKIKDKDESEIKKEYSLWVKAAANSAKEVLKDENEAKNILNDMDDYKSETYKNYLKKAKDNQKSLQIDCEKALKKLNRFKKDLQNNEKTTKSILSQIKNILNNLKLKDVTTGVTSFPVNDIF